MASKKARIRAWIEARRPAAVTGAVWAELLRELAPISESYLREVLRETGLPFEQPWAGVRQKSLEELERSLVEIGAVYAGARASGHKELARYCRKVVIAAKDHARFASSRHPEKLEMVEWMLVWLGDPSIFPSWVRQRKQSLDMGLS